MLTSAIAWVRSFFKTETPPAAPATVRAAMPPPPINLDPPTDYEITVRHYINEGAIILDHLADGGVVMLTGDRRWQVSVHPDGRTTSALLGENELLAVAKLCKAS